MGLSEAKLQRLEHQAADPIDVSALIFEDEGRTPTVRIDLTSPPSPIVAIVGEIEAEGASADAATRALGRAKARALRDAASRGE